MVNDEEKKAIEQLKELSKQCHNSKCWTEKICSDCYVEVEDILAIDTILNLTDRLKKENEELKEQIMLIAELSAYLQYILNKKGRK